MTKPNLVAISTLMCLAVQEPTLAYELGTHARLTEQAYLGSVLATDERLLDDLGLDRLDLTEPLGDRYWYIFEQGHATLFADPLEDQFMRDNADSLKIQGWLMRGAIREDDYPGADNGLRDPFDGGLIRPWNHFYDPVRDLPLTVGTKLGDKALDWAIGSADAFAQPNTPNSGRRNRFSVFDAREAMYRALTGRDMKNNGIAISSSDRKAYWATTFRALGDIAHLIQDMAQSQHTRNDQHAGIPLLTSVVGRSSTYEFYIDARATGSRAKERETQRLDPTIKTFRPINYSQPDGTPYPTPRFGEYNDFFSTRDRDTAAQGFGLADYSNRGFFTIGTNLGDNDYPLPPNDRHQFAEQVISINSDTKTAYLLDGVFDRLNPALRVLDVPKTKENIWYEPLLEFADAGVAEKFGYTLDQRIYDAQADLLIPRAVAYSAGLIDYFFRGRLEAVDPTFTDEGVNLKVKNAIDRNKIPEWGSEHLYREDSQGNPSQFVLTLKYKQDETEKLEASDPVTLKAQSLIAPGVTSFETLTFDLPRPPDDATDVEYRLVFRGRLGTEDDAIAVGIVEPVSGFVVNPNYVPADGISGSRLIVKTKGKWQLTTQRNLQGRQIDWKGWYIRGRPTKVLTYSGPIARYFPEVYSNIFGSIIYQNGELFARTPCPILGAAITEDTDNKEWIIVICKEGLEDVVYRRENVKDTSSFGWEEIGRVLAQTGAKEADVPWFFNGGGTEAQTMRLSPRIIEGVSMPAWRDRYKITITGAAAVQFENLGNEFGVQTETRDQTCFPSVINSSGTQSIVQQADFRSVAAVDYIDATEILAYWRIRRSSNNYSEESAESQIFVDKIDSKFMSSLVWGSNEVVVSERVVFHDNFRIGITYPGIEGKILQRHKDQFAWILYLDVREDLLLYFNQIFERMADTGGVVPGHGDVQRVDSETWVYKMWHKGKAETIYENVTSTEFVDPGACCPSIGVCDFPPFESGTFTTTKIVSPGAPGSDPRYHLGAPLRLRFSTAADSGHNVFISMQYAEKDDARHWFNSLTDGDPTVILPGAPSEPRYWPVYVVK